MFTEVPGSTSLGVTKVLNSKPTLAGGFNPFETYAPQIGSFPQVKVQINNIWNHHLELVCILDQPQKIPRMQLVAAVKFGCSWDSRT